MTCVTDCIKFQYCDQIVDCSVQCVIRSRNHDTTVLYLSNLEHTQLCTSYSTLCCVCMSQSLFKSVDGQVKAFVGT